MEMKITILEVREKCSKCNATRVWQRYKEGGHSKTIYNTEKSEDCKGKHKWSGKK